MLRFVGCRLPLQWWYKDLGEYLPWMERCAEEVGATLVSCYKVRKRFDHPEYGPHPTLGGFERKPYSIYHSGFDECMLLDADIVPVRDPTYLFDDVEYRAHGSLFWPDIKMVPPDHPLWQAAGIAPDLGAYGFQGGQQIVNVKRCSFQMEVTLDLNFDSKFWYQRHLTYGEQDLYRVAWRMLGRPYGIIPVKTGRLERTLLAFDRLGRRVFQHRCGDKWQLDGSNLQIRDFWFEERCFRYLSELRDIIATP